MPLDDEALLTALNMNPGCLLMFSGGRDSTLAALRLNESGESIHLVTVTSAHLVGIEAVRVRLRELGGILPAETAWTRVVQPSELFADVSVYLRTCLPCHHAYVITAIALCRTLGLQKTAFGYAGYQSSWVEQTPEAVERLGSLLDRVGLQLVLPVYDIASRGAAVDELQSRGLSEQALEQKCLRQVTNVRLTSAELASQLDYWEAGLMDSMSHLAAVDVTIVEQSTLGTR
jgi:hypothetical protein